MYAIVVGFAFGGIFLVGRFAPSFSVAGLVAGCVLGYSLAAIVGRKKARLIKWPRPWL
jgi:membrane associated rhomboid family serine protease